MNIIKTIRSPLQEGVALSMTDENKLLQRPTLQELTEHIHIGTKWYLLGVQLSIDSKELNMIEESPKDIRYKICKMFELWLSHTTDATRRDVLVALRKKIISENTLADEYEKAVTNDILLGIYQYKNDVYIVWRSTPLHSEESSLFIC